MENNQYTQPEITAKKYKVEVDNFKKIFEIWREKGVFLVKEEFPILEFIFHGRKVTPSPLAFAVRIDFSNYDVEPPSVKFICPFTSKLLTRKEVQTQFIQIRKPDHFNPNLPIKNQIQQQDLLQGGPDEIPFFCIPGVREYHDHPAHTGDSWLLYRKKGEGTLGFILDQLYDHSIPTITSYKLGLVVTGLNNEIKISF